MSLNKNTMNKEETQKRILLATVISFAFFIAYDFFYLQPKQELINIANTKNKQIEKKSDSKLGQNLAPVLNTIKSTAKEAPESKDIQNTLVISTITTKKNIIKIDNLGRISQVILTEPKYIDKDGNQIKLFTSDQLRPLEIRFSDPKINAEAFSTKVVSSAKTLDASKNTTKLTLVQSLSKTTLTKTLTFYPDGHYDIDISSTKKADFFITPGFRPDVLADMYTDHGALLTLNDGTLSIIKDTKMDSVNELTGVNISSAFDRYYATVLYNFNQSMIVSVMKDETDSPQIFIHAKNNISLHGYVGPKEYKNLNDLDQRLTAVIEYGWFTFIAKPMFLMLQFIYNYVGNWGWTIVFVTLLVKLILLPLSHKGMVSMNKLKQLAPKVKAIQEKYKDDKQKSSMHMMELYKNEGANPMGGCLPVVLQIPIFFSIYRVLLNAIELKGAPWMLWIDDLSLMDPYFVLPVLMGATMFLQQKITPNTMTDPMQQKMFQFLPVVFTFFFLWFPAGLTLYWFMNNLATVSQQYYVNTLFKNEKETRHKKHLEQKADHNNKKK